MAKPDELTKRQRAVFKFICREIKKRGYGPTVREIAQQFDISSPNGVMCHLRALEKKGLINRAPNRSRAIQVNQPLEEESGLPLVGQVSAGTLNEAIEQAERIDFGAMFARDNQFVLKVAGDSMIDAQIADGDYVVIKRQSIARKGDIVVAQTEDGEATLKYWFPEKNRIRLQPANTSMKPIYVRKAKVLGVLAGVVRKTR